MSALQFPGPTPVRLLVLPVGELRYADGRGPFRLTDPFAVVRDAQPRLPLIIDENFATSRGQRDGRSGVACGWITELSAEAHGIWAEVSWTPRGRSLLEDRAYRFLAPAFDADTQGRLTRLLRASLTNLPEIAGAMPIETARDPVALNAAQLITARGIALRAREVQDERRNAGRTMSLPAAVQQVVWEQAAHGAVHAASPLDARQVAEMAQDLQAEAGKDGHSMSFAEAVARVVARCEGSL